MTENRVADINGYCERNWKLLAALMLLFSAAASLYGSGLGFFYDIDEPKYARAVYEMVHTGNFLAPMFDGIPRMEKPPLAYWVMYPFVWLAAKGGPEAVGFLVLRAPAVLCSMLMALGTALIGRRLFGASTGLMAAVLMQGSILFKFMSVMMKVDIVFSCCVTWSVYFYLLHYLGDRRRSVLVKGGLVTALGVLAKGPFAFLPLAGFVLACIVRKNVCLMHESGKGASFMGSFAPSGMAAAAREHLRPVLFWFVVGCIPFFAWLYFAYLSSGFDYTQGLVGQFFHNTATTSSKAVHKLSRLDPYLDTLTVIFFPWGGYLFGTVYGLWRTLREKYNEKYVFSICIILVYMLVFTLLFKLKSNRYMLPVLPLVSILISDWLMNAKRDKAYRTLFEMGFIWLCSMAAMLLYRSFKFKMVTVNLADGVRVADYLSTVTPFLISAGVFFIIMLTVSIFQSRRPAMHIIGGSIAILLVMPFYYKALPSYASMTEYRPLPILGQYLSDEIRELGGDNTLVLHRPFFVQTFPDVVYYLKKLDKDGRCMYSLGSSAHPMKLIQALATPTDAAELFSNEHEDAARYPAYSYFKNTKFDSAVLLLGVHDYRKFGKIIEQMPPMLRKLVRVEKKKLLSVKWVPEYIYTIRFDATPKGSGQSGLEK